jgi:hypothetical protein
MTLRLCTCHGEPIENCPCVIAAFAPDKRERKRTMTCACGRPTVFRTRYCLECRRDRVREKRAAAYQRKQAG